MNHIRCYTYVKSRESAKTVVNMVTRVEIMRREKKRSTICTAKRTDTPLNNVTARRSKGKNAHTFTRRETEKRSAGRNKNMAKKNKSKRLMSLKRYITTSSYLTMMQSRAKIKQSNEEI